MSTFSRGMRLLGSIGMVTLGNGLGAFLGFAVLAVLTRSLPPEAFGKVAMIIAIIDGGQLFIDTLVNVGIVFKTAREGRDPAEETRLLRVGFWLKAFAVLVLGLAITAFAGPLSRWLALPDLEGLLPFAALGIAFASFQGFLITVAQVRMDFRSVGLLSPAKNIARLACLLAVLALGHTDLATLAFAIVAGTFVAALASLPRVRFDCLAWPETLRQDAAAMMRINGWMLIVAVSVVANRVDIWLISGLHSLAEAGLYAAALQVCMAVGIVSQAIVTTLLPKAAKLTEKAEMRRYVLRCLAWSPAALAPGLVFAAFAEPFTVLLLGRAYAGAATAMSVILMSSLVTLASNPLAMILLSMNESRIFGLSSGVLLALRTGLALALIPFLGALGAASADLAARLIVVLALVIYLLRHLQEPARPAP